MRKAAMPHKTSLATWHHCLGHSNANANANSQHRIPLRPAVTHGHKQTQGSTRHSNGHNRNQHNGQAFVITASFLAHSLTLSIAITPQLASLFASHQHLASTLTSSTKYGSQGPDARDNDSKVTSSIHKRALPHACNDNSNVTISVHKQTSPYTTCSEGACWKCADHAVAQAAVRTLRQKQ